jgi:hypothetical protein
MQNSQRSTDPALYIVPDGFIELSRAVEKTVRQCFGETYVSDLTPERLALEISKNQFDKSRRDRRWTLAKRLLLRAFLRGKLRTFLLKNGEPKPLSVSYWREWESSWRPFSIDPLGRSGIPVHLLCLDEWTSWIAHFFNNKETAAPQEGHVTRIDGELTLSTTAEFQVKNSNNRGPKPTKLNEVMNQMRSSINNGTCSADFLRHMKEEQMVETFKFDGEKVSRDTARRARNCVLRNYDISTNFDKTPTIDN